MEWVAEVETEESLLTAGTSGRWQDDLELGILGVTLNRALPSIIKLVWQPKSKSGNSKYALNFSAISYPRFT